MKRREQPSMSRDEVAVLIYKQWPQETEFPHASDDLFDLLLSVYSRIVLVWDHSFYVPKLNECRWKFHARLAFRICVCVLDIPCSYAQVHPFWVSARHLVHTK